MATKTVCRTDAGTPGWYVLEARDGALVDAGENLASICGRAREVGDGAVVREIQHPKFRKSRPFGFHYMVMAEAAR